MFKESVEPIFFKTRFGIHTFFVKKPIDILILDDKLKIKKLKENLKPWNVYLWNPRYKNVIELPGGFINKKELFVGMKIIVRNTIS